MLVEQLNMTLKRAEHCLVLHVPQVPVIVVFQSVCSSSKRHSVRPPLEILVQGSDEPGKFATVQSAGIGTSQL